MVERGTRQLERLRATGDPLSSSSDSRAHLDQAVEAAAVAPRSLPAIGIDPGDDQRRVERAQPVMVETDPPQGVGPQSAHQDVRLGNQWCQDRGALRRAQVEGCAALARRHDRQQATDLRVVRRVDAQYVCTVSGEEPRAGRPRDDPGQIQHSNALQRPGRRPRQLSRAAATRGLHHRWQHARGGTCRMCAPLLGRGASAPRILPRRSQPTRGPRPATLQRPQRPWSCQRPPSDREHRARPCGASRRRHASGSIRRRTGRWRRCGRRSSDAAILEV